MPASIEECIIPDAWANRQEGLPGALAPPANNSGRANGSILSLVNRAVKSNIFMRECQRPFFHENLVQMEWAHRVLWNLSRVRDKVDKQKLGNWLLQVLPR